MAILTSRNGGRDHLVLSPHFDDAVGSCGGMMQRLRDSQASVGVLTLFGGEPRAPLSELARRFHRSSGVDGVAARRAEDEAACRVLGVTADSLDYPDGIYRTQSNGDHLYPKPGSITGAVAASDHGLEAPMTEAVLGRLPSLRTIVYCPMAIGGHVDHVLTRNCGLRLAALGIEVVFYADFFYTAFAGPTVAPNASEDDIRLGPIEFLAKVRAFSKYRSQVQALFGGRRRFFGHFWRHGWVEHFLPAERLRVEGQVGVVSR